MRHKYNKAGGRPTKKTPAVMNKIVELIRKGNYYMTAAKACGISYSTFLAWSRSDKEFSRAIKEAEAAAEAACLDAIELAGLDPRNWTSVAWRMERRWPRRWGKRESTQATVSVADNKGATNPSVTVALSRALLDRLTPLEEDINGTGDHSVAVGKEGVSQNQGSQDIEPADCCPGGSGKHDD